MRPTAPLSAAEWRLWDTWMRAQRRLELEVDRALQRDIGISKAEFGVLVTLRSTRDGRMRVTELADSLGWDKSRVAHLLTRMEVRGLVARSEAGAAGRRTGITLTPAGAETAERAVDEHGRNLRRLVFDRMSADQLAAIATWSGEILES